MNQNKIIAVTGATGKQGGAVAKSLWEAGFQVRALTRNPASPMAAKLKQQGMEVIPADMEDVESLKKSLDGAYGVFSVQNYWEKGVGYEGEIRQGKNLVDAAKSAGVGHFVQASVADAEKPEGVKHWECKAVLEEYIKEKQLPFTFLGETFFMENFMAPKNGKMIFPFLSGILKSNTRFHMVSVKDIGAVTAVVFQEPEKYIGKKVNIAGDCLTISEMKAVYNKVMPKKAPGYAIPAWLSNILNREMVKQVKWNNDPGWQFDLSETKAVYPQLTSFEDFLKSQSAS
ncbi:NmrA/HSCARG family protein [Negadavirga shengliensis]|uniref:NmrA/HSCARG family protein n=1 Tax=Negadavirga shengliensis TaxID=1389218 RepID=A0ABV9SWI6_9BACT